MKALTASHHLRCCHLSPRCVHLTSDPVDCILHHRVNYYVAPHFFLHYSKYSSKNHFPYLEEGKINLDLSQFDHIYYSFDYLSSFKHSSSPKNINVPFSESPSSENDDILTELVSCLKEYDGESSNRLSPSSSYGLLHTPLSQSYKLGESLSPPLSIVDEISPPFNVSPILFPMPSPVHDEMKFLFFNPLETIMESDVSSDASLQTAEVDETPSLHCEVLNSSPHKIKDLFTLIYLHFQLDLRFPYGQITIPSLCNLLHDCRLSLPCPRILLPILAFNLYILLSFGLLLSGKHLFWTRLYSFLKPFYPVCLFIRFWNHLMLGTVLLFMPLFITIPLSKAPSNADTVLGSILLSNQSELSFIEGLSLFVYTSSKKCEALIEFSILYFWFREFHGTMNLGKCVALVLHLEQQQLLH